MSVLQTLLLKCDTEVIGELNHGRGNAHHVAVAKVARDLATNLAVVTEGDRGRGPGHMTGIEVVPGENQGGHVRGSVLGDQGAVGLARLQGE